MSAIGVSEPARLLALKYPGLSAADRERIAVRADAMVIIHGGDIERAHGAAGQMCGNVSLRARASMAPVADFLGWMRP